MMARKIIRFDQGYRFYETLKVDSFNGNKDYLVGSVSIEDPPDAVYIGKISEFDGLMGRDVWLDTKAAHVVYVIGKRRSGKSYSLGTIVEGLVSQSLRIGKMNQAGLILDTLNIYWTMEKSPGEGDRERPELERWGLSPEPVKPLVCYYPRGFRQDFMPDRYREFAIRPNDLDGNDWANLFEVDPVVDPMGQLISELYEKVVIEGYSTGSAQIPAKQEYELGDMVKCLDNSTEIQRFPSQVREAVRRRLKSVERIPVFSSQGTNVRDLFRAGQITVLLLRDLDALLRGVLIGILIRRIMALRGVTAEAEKRLEIRLRESKRLETIEENRLEGTVEKGIPRGWILIDEAHNYIPQSGIIGSKAALKKYVNEGRNIGLSLAVTTQQPSGLDASIRRNADVLLIHRITMQADLDTTASMLNTSVPDAVEVRGERIKSRAFDAMVRELPLGFAIVSSTNANRVFMIKVRPRTSLHGGSEF
jgi:DNA helicase HerA-like ATPase